MRSTLTAIGVTLVLTPLASALADQGVPRLMLDRELKERAITLVGVDEQQVAYRDDAGMLRSQPVQRIVAITAPRDEWRGPEGLIDPGDQPAVLELTDGQRLIGRILAPIAEASPGEIVRWMHPLLGEIGFRLDDIERITLDKASLEGEVAEAATGDVVILRNGDRLEGFVESIGAAVHLEYGGQVRQLPLDRVASIALANPPAALDGDVLWLRDGSIVSSARFATMPEGQIAFLPRAGRSADDPQERSESAALPVAVGDVMAIAFDAGQLAPLASLPVVREEPYEGRRWSPPLQRYGPLPALLNTSDLELPGPMLVEWELPPGAVRFAAEAELPRANWNWGDCILVVSLVSGRGEAEQEVEVTRSRINAENPVAAFNIDLQRRDLEGLPGHGPLRLRMILDPGMYGPIQDQIILRRPLVLVEDQSG